jgi:catalase-peroxidase
MSQLVSTALGAPPSVRGSDKRGGANGANHSARAPEELGSESSSRACEVSQYAEGIQKNFNAAGKKVSLADLIVLGGSAAVEEAAKKAGYNINVPSICPRSKPAIGRSPRQLSEKCDAPQDC